MRRFQRLLAPLAILGSLGVGAPALAQYYPRGYAGYGWGGWGGATPAGRTAAGMGVFAAGAGQYAAGAGQYNEETAQARAINTQTAEQFNDYMYTTSKQHAQDYYKELAAKASQGKQDYRGIQDRILNHPTTADIVNGDTLNAIYMEITDPRIYGQMLAAADAPIAGSMVRQIPFNYASAGLTYSLAQLTSRESVPEVFNSPSFAEQRQEIAAIAAELKRETSGQQQPKPETIRRFRAGLDKVKATLERVTRQGSPEQFEGEQYLKALYGLAKMLQSPSYDVYLAGVEKIPNVPIRDVLTFMHAFNLRFGKAESPEQRELYSQLYGVLSALRPGAGEPAPGAAAAPAPPPPGPSNAGMQPPSAVTNFFSKMDYSHVQPHGAPPPPQPRP